MSEAIEMKTEQEIKQRLVEIAGEEMTDRSDLEIIMGAIEYGRNIGADAGHASRVFILYYVLGVMTGVGIAFMVTV